MEMLKPIVHGMRDEVKALSPAKPKPKPKLMPKLMLMLKLKTKSKDVPKVVATANRA